MTEQEQPLGVSGAEDRPVSDEEEAEAARMQNRFDIRRLIGALFALYGLILTVLGIFGTSHVKNKAAGINIDLWTGLGMLVFAGLMIFWALARPVSTARPEDRGQGSGRIRRAPAT